MSSAGGTVVLSDDGGSPRTTARAQSSRIAIAVFAEDASEYLDWRVME
jgi:hypothetical protein